MSEVAKSAGVHGPEARPLVIAVPKGRVLKQLGKRLARAGIDPAVLVEDDRRLVREDVAAGIRFLLLKPDDVPTYVEYGAAVNGPTVQSGYGPGV